jgi:hypothetical protein
VCPNWENPVNDIEKLLAIEEIRRLKARYFRYVDTKDWAAFKTIFTPDAHFDISEDLPDGVLLGPDSIVEAARIPLSGVVSVHHGHCPEIDITSDTTATGIWAMEDKLRWSENSEFPNQTLHGYGHYFEGYEKVGD